jgi:hypothetical protein
MEQFESLREAESLRFRFQMNNRLRLESLAAVSKVFREFGEPISDDLLSSLVFAVPSELIPSNDFGYVVGAEDLHAGQYDPSAPPQAPGPPQAPKPSPSGPPQAPKPSPSGPPQAPKPSPSGPPQAPKPEPSGPPQGPKPGPPPGPPPGMPPGPPQAPNP